MADTVVASTANSNMVDRPLWLQAKDGDSAISMQAQDYRALIEALVPNEGVLASTHFAVTQNGLGDGSVNVSGGHAVIAGDGASNLGSYLIKSLGTVNLTIPVAGGGITRTHRVIIRVRDGQISGSNYDWTLEVLEDTGSGTPALPNSAISLATVSRTGSNAVLTANITDARSVARVAGYDAQMRLVGSRLVTTGNLYTGSAWTDVATVNVPVTAGRNYGVEVDGFVSTTSGSAVALGAALHIPGANLAEIGVIWLNYNGDSRNIKLGTAYAAPTTTTLAFSLSVGRLSGSGTFTVEGSTGRRFWLRVYDLGTAVSLT